MKLALSLVAFVTFAVVAFSRMSPLTDGLEIWALGIGVVAAGVTWGADRVARSLERRRSAQQVSRPIHWIPAAAALVLAFATERIVVHVLARYAPNFWVLEGAYYFVLCCLGVALARLGRAPGFVAGFGALVLTGIPVMITFAELMNSAGASFHYGPEKVLFAIADAVRVLVVAPLDVAVTWSAWRITLSFSGGPNQSLASAPAPTKSPAAPEVIQF
jgi:hypothetical protein